MKTFTLKSDGFLARYDYLSRLSTDRWAWEFARRNKDLRADAKMRQADDISEREACSNIRILRSRVSQTLAERWGLAFLPDPDLDGFRADTVWSHYVFPDQVEVACTPRKPGQSCDIWDRTLPVCQITHITDRSSRQYLLLSMEPVRMKLQIADMKAYERKLKIQQDAMAIYGDGPDISEARWTKSTQIMRNGLIALDGLEAGMSRRDLAALISGSEAVDADWGEDGGTLRAHLRYVITKAEGLRDGGYLVELLGARLGSDRQAA